MPARSLILHVRDWQDREFVQTFEAALAEARITHDPVDAAAAQQVQAELRSHGYDEACVECRASVDDVLAGITRWTISRGGLAHSAPHA
ncbi:MAG: hypothetical protein U0667_04455 [Chloroflexota bacterium]|mgnify:CR=1 FL=1